MSQWMRVFSRYDREPDRQLLTAAVYNIEGEISLTFHDGERGWQQSDIVLDGKRTSVIIDRYFRDEEGIRAELQAWAAWLETCDYHENHQMLMQHMIQTQQLFTIKQPVDYADEVLLDRLCIMLCQHLAKETEGVYQLDGQGFFDAEGTLLLQEY